MFKGDTEEKVEKSLDALSMEPWIHYPLPGGTALVTFERPEGESRAHPNPALKCSDLWGSDGSPSPGNHSWSQRQTIRTAGIGEPLAFFGLHVEGSVVQWVQLTSDL